MRSPNRNTRKMPSTDVPYAENTGGTGVDRIQARHDLELFPVEGYAQAPWVVRDPLTRTCFHFGVEEHFLLTHLNACQSLEELREAFQRRFAPRELRAGELENLIVDWSFKQLLLTDPLLIAEWRRRLGTPSLASRPARGWHGIFASPLVIRFRGWNPQRFLDGLTPWLGWIYTGEFLVVALLVMLSAGLIAIAELPSLLHELQQLPLLFGPEHWLLVVVCLGLTKVLHELGHAVTCHHYGGKCTEMGVMLLACIPCLYCNVTDAWTFRRRRERVAVSAAGIFVDLLVASLCLLAWHFSEPGIFHAVCLLLAVVGSVNSLLLNGNPLMRYDGYYICGDLLGKANLRSESLRQARLVLWRFLMGPRSEASGERVSPGMCGYGLAAGLYLWLVLVLILVGFYQLLKPTGFQPLIVAAGCLLIPAQLWGTGRVMYPEGRREYRLRNRRLGRVQLSLLVGTVLIAALLFLPFPRRIPATGVLMPRAAEPIVIRESGLLRETADTGATLHHGETIYRLANADLEQQAARLETDQRAWQASEQSIQRKRTQLADAAEVLALIAERQSTLVEQSNRLRDRLAHLEKQTDRTGRLIPSPLPGTVGGEDYWNTLDPLALENRGRFLPEGNTLGEFAPDAGYTLLIAVEEHWSRLLVPGADSLVFLPQSEGQPQTGTLIQLAPGVRREAREKEQIPAQQVLDTYLSRQPGAERQARVAGYVQMEASAAENWGMYQVCQVRLAVPPASLWQRFREMIARTWRDAHL